MGKDYNRIIILTNLIRNTIIHNDSNELLNNYIDELTRLIYNQDTLYFDGEVDRKMTYEEYRDLWGHYDKPKVKTKKRR